MSIYSFTEAEMAAIRDADAKIETVRGRRITAMCGGDRRSKAWCSKEESEKAGNPLYACRTALGLTQREMGEKLHTAQEHISCMERGTRKINPYVETWLRSEGWL